VTIPKINRGIGSVAGTVHEVILGHFKVHGQKCRSVWVYLSHRFHN
jgi:hypothetical protein